MILMKMAIKVMAQCVLKFSLVTFFICFGSFFFLFLLSNNKYFPKKDSNSDLFAVSNSEFFFCAVLLFGNSFVGVFLLSL